MYYWSGRGRSKLVAASMWWLIHESTTYNLFLVRDDSIDFYIGSILRSKCMFRFPRLGRNLNRQSMSHVLHWNEQLCLTEHRRELSAVKHLYKRSVCMCNSDSSRQNKGHFENRGCLRALLCKYFRTIPIRTSRGNFRPSVNTIMIIIKIFFTRWEFIISIYKKQVWKFCTNLFLQIYFRWRCI